MPRVALKWEGRCCLSWTCLSNATLECTSPAKRFPLNNANLNSTSTTKTRTNKYTRRLSYTERTLLNLKIQKNWSTKYQRINTQPMKTKTIKYTRRSRYIGYSYCKPVLMMSFHISICFFPQNILETTC